jgi:hypothetical protein
MMCTCRAAPVAAALRRTGVPTSVAVAYWLGNPLLNPAVLAFPCFVARDGGPSLAPSWASSW